MSTDPHLGCIADAREDAAAARRDLLTHEAVAGASLTSPAEDPTDRWTLELAILTGPDSPAAGLEPAVLDTARCHGLTVIEVQRRSPRESRAVLTV
jgi:hypothetical protein